MSADPTLGRPVEPARRLAAVLEPVAAQVYFSPECHGAYEALGFDPSPRTTRAGVALPDWTAYFTSRGSALGQAPGSLVASVFAVFDPAAVVPAVTRGWSLTDAATIAAVRSRGAVAQLERVLGVEPDGVERAGEHLARAVDALRPEGRPLFAGLSALNLPGRPVGDVWRRADLLREYRGDAHNAAWTSAGLDAVEIGLLTELFWGMPMGSYIRTRFWSPDELEAGKDRLRTRGFLEGDGFSPAGRAARQAIEEATDLQVAPAIDALGDDLDDLVAVLGRWSASIWEAGGYPPAGPHDMAAQADAASP